MFKKKFTLKTWGENNKEVLTYLEQIASSIEVKSITKIRNESENDLLQYVIKGKCSKADLSSLKELKDVTLI